MDHTRSNVPPTTPRPAARGRRGHRWSWYAAGLLVLVMAVAGIAKSRQVYHAKTGKASAPEAKAHAPKPAAGGNGIARVAADSIRVGPDVMQSLAVKTAEAKAAEHPRPLPPLPGTLAINNARQARVHSPFAGVVVALGTVGKGETDDPTDPAGPRALTNGDAVEANQLLAVVWSKDLGEKKSELVDAVSRLKADRDNLTRLTSLTEGIVEKKRIVEAEAAVRADENAVARVIDTLRAWRLPEPEIQAIQAEAERLGGGAARRELTAGKTWARVEIRAPFAGVVMDRNTNIRDVVDTAADLFRVADLSKLTVWVPVYDDDLPAFQKLPKPVEWEVRLRSRPDYHFAGRLEQIGPIVDQYQHTALAYGTVDNPDGSLKVGQPVSVTVAMPPNKGEVEIPTSALIEDGKTSTVFVQPDPAVPVFVRRPVVVTRRLYDVVYLAPASALTGGLEPGERVVSAGALQLNQVFLDRPGAPAAK